MKLFIYKTYLRLVVLLVWSIYPISGVLVPFLFSKAQKRKAFELKNLKDPHSREHTKADICFEVSSEGELEQVIPLVEEFLKKSKIIELVFSSKSVEKKILDLAGRYPDNLYIFRLPLISFTPFYNPSWIKAEVLVLCRYDFYPHLILQGLKKKKFILLSGSLKGKKYPRVYPYCFFDLIVCASNVEKRNFEKLLGSTVPLLTMDLRVIRIMARLEKSNQTLKKISSYREKLGKVSYSNRIILGSYYPEDSKIFENKNLLKMIADKKIHICIVPHKLDQANILKIQESLPKELKTLTLKDNCEISDCPEIALVLVPGILCELYSLFAHAYVGGGFQKSIHSVLEPYLAGSRIYCGPKTHRSTEFDFVTAHSKENISVVTNLLCFYDDLVWDESNKSNLDFKDDLKKIISYIEEGISS